MFGSEILEIAIGLAFVYLLLSLMGSTLMEIIARMFKMRSSKLEKAISNMLQGESVNAATETNIPVVETANSATEENLLSKFYKHGLVDTLGKQSVFDQVMSKITRQKVREESRPSYIPTNVFALAVIDIVMEDGQPTVAVDQGTATSSSDSPVDGAGGTSAQAQSPSAAPFQRLEAGAKKLHNELPLKSALTSILNSTKMEIDPNTDPQKAMAKVRAGIETWFDATMERVTGWYKRDAQLVILLFAFVISFAYNVDTLSITSALAHDGPLRKVIANQAVEYAADNQPFNNTNTQTSGSEGTFDEPESDPLTSAEKGENPASVDPGGEDSAFPSTGSAADGGTDASEAPTSAEGGENPVGADQGEEGSAFPPTEPVTDDASPTNSNAKAQVTFDDLEQELKGLGLPIGWVKLQESAEGAAEAQLPSSTTGVTNPWSSFINKVTEPFIETVNVKPDEATALQKARQIPQGAAWVTKLLGILMTTLAISLGAPFWFDVLNQLSNLRATGKKPKEAPTTETSTVETSTVSTK